MDVSRLNEGEKIAVGAAILLAIDMTVVAWFGVGDAGEPLGTAPGLESTFNAWQSFGYIDLLLLATIALAIGTVFVKATGTQVDFPFSTVVTLLGALSTILVLYRMIDPPGGTSVKVGVFLGAILAATLACGGWLAMQSEAQPP